VLPRTRYAIASGGVHVAYQVVGEGPRDVVWIPGAFSNLEHWWAHPRAERFLTAISRHCRLILFDKRGSGLSDRMSRAQSLEERVDDIDAVMHAAGSEHATIWGVSEGAPFAVVFAASHPGMVDGLILQGGLARWTATPEYPWAMPLEIYRGTREFILANWGEG
jgi:pimeloyl-ACP methyl ester carboxylesterase